jgi:RNA polymerase sigma-70 factor (ECF subfamily)
MMQRVPRNNRVLAYPPSIIQALSPESVDLPSLSTQNLRGWTQRIVQGDEKAFETFYELYSVRLYRLLLIVTRGHEELAQEIQQIVLIKVARKFKTFDTESELWAWLSQVARNAFIDHVRKQSRYSNFVFTEPSAGSVAGSQASFDCGRSLLDRLEEALGGLETEDRDLLESAYFQDCGHKEIAALSGKSVKSIESKLARVREKLRQLILRSIRNESETR